MDSKGTVNVEYEKLHQIDRCVLDGSALVGEVYADISDKQLVNIYKFDRDGRPTTEMTRKREKSVNL